MPPFCGVQVLLAFFANDALSEGSFALSGGKAKDISFEVRVTAKVYQTVIDRIIAHLELTKGGHT